MQKKKKKFRKEKNEWKSQVYLLDRDFVHNEIAFKKKGGPAIFYWIKLGLGILAIVGALLWIIQIVIWTNLQVYPFLNFMLAAMDGIWQFFGTLFFASFAVNLLIGVVKGAFKWGIRVPLFMTLHPMKRNETMQNSILVNVVIILVASVAVSQYLAASFSVYARSTAINAIFNIAIKNTRYLYWYFVVIYWAFPGIAVIAVIFFAIRPADRQKKMMLEAQKSGKKKKEKKSDDD